MANQLFLIEGLPGSGKSTTAKMVHEILKSKGIKSELFLEGNPHHPADYEGVAFFTHEQFGELVKVHSSSEEILQNMKISIDNGFLFPYKMAFEEENIALDESLLHDIFKNDIYELPLPLNTRMIVDRWEQFARNNENNDCVFIFECCFIQNPVTVSMVKYGASEQVTINYIHQLCEKINCLEPVLIYVDQENIRESFTKAVEERPKEWFNGFVDYYTKQGYGLARNYQGLDGTLKVLEAREMLEMKVFDALPINKYIIDNTSFQHEVMEQKIIEIVEKNITNVMIN